MTSILIFFLLKTGSSVEIKAISCSVYKQTPRSYHITTGKLSSIKDVWNNGLQMILQCDFHLHCFNICTKISMWFSFYIDTLFSVTTKGQKHVVKKIHRLNKNSKILSEYQIFFRIVGIFTIRCSLQCLFRSSSGCTIPLYLITVESFIFMGTNVRDSTKSAYN